MHNDRVNAASRKVSAIKASQEGTATDGVANTPVAVAAQIINLQTVLKGWLTTVS